MKKSDFRKKKKRCGHCKGHFMWAPESVQPLLAPGRYSLWASNCDVPTALTQAQSRKLHLACSLCQGLSTPDHWCAPCCSKLLDSNFFFCQDRTRWFPFLGGLLFYGSLWRIPWVLRYHGSFLSLHMLPGCLGLEKIKAGPPPCYSLRTSTLTPEIPRPWGYVQHSTIFFFASIADSPLLLPLKFNFSCHILPAHPKFTMPFSLSKAQVQPWFKFFLEDILTPHANHRCKYILGLGSWGST